MSTLLVVLAVRAAVVLAVIAAVVGVGVLVRRRLRRTGRWGRVQQLVRSGVLSQPGGAPTTGVRAVATRALHRWVEGGTNR